MGSTVVVNRRTSAFCTGDAYVGRPSKWGNPYPMFQESDRARVIQKYRRRLEQNLRSDPSLIEELAKLAGGRLVCWCAPKACHADVLAEAAEWAAAGADWNNASWTVKRREHADVH